MEGDEKSNENFVADYFGQDPANLTGESESFGLEPENAANINRRPIKEKILTVAIVVVCFLAVITGVYQLNQSIKSPFLAVMKGAKDQADASAKCFNGDCELQAQILAAWQLKKTDTDGDGLSDFDEVNIYETSPYLEDSDSDGYSDKEEADQGFDPNCPGTETCFRDATNANTNSQTPILGQTPTTEMPALSAAQLRETLATSGIPAEELASLSDQELVQFYQETVSSYSQGASIVSPDTSQTTATANSNPNSSATGAIDTSQIKSIDDLKNISGAQLRAMLIEQGAPADLLSSVSDDELKQMFLDKLNAQSQTQ